MKYHNFHNIEKIEELIVKSTDFFVTPIKQNYFDNAKNILEKLKCLDKDGDLTLDFYLIREIFKILQKSSHEIKFSIFDAKMILESFIYDCVDEVIEIIVCCKYLNYGSLSNLFNTESKEQTALEKNKNKFYKKKINKKNLYKKYKKFINPESDHLTIYNLYQSYKEGQDFQKLGIMPNAFKETEVFTQNYSSIKIFTREFKNICKEQRKKFPKEFEKLEYLDFIDKFQKFFTNKENKENYIDVIKATLEKIANLKSDRFKNINMKISKNPNLDIKQILTILNDIILNKNNLTLKDQIILNLTQVFNQELQIDNNKVFKKINHILGGIKKYKKNDISMKTKILYSLYWKEDIKNEDYNFQENDQIGSVKIPSPNDPSNDPNMININSKNEIMKHPHNNLQKNIIRCIVAGYSVHICQNKEKEQEGGGWWPFSSGKADITNDITNENENYINYFPTTPTPLTKMFEENEDNTLVNFKNPNRKYIIYNTLTTKRNFKNPDKPYDYMANVITIIPEIFIDIIPQNNSSK